MLNQVEVYSDLGELLTLPLEDISSGYMITDISGLEPVVANIVSTSFASMDGEVYQASRRGKRNIVISLELDPDYSVTNVRGLRNHLYQFFMPKKEVILRFFTDDMRPVDIQGRVESFDSPLFAQTPQATISLLCFSPDFYEPEDVILPRSTTSSSTEFIVDYEGTTDTGIILELKPNRAMTGFTINSTAPGEATRTFQFDDPLVSGDILTLSTIQGAKGIKLVRGGVESSYLRGMVATSDWTRLYPGSNALRVYAAGAAVPYTLRYTNKYGGL